MPRILVRLQWQANGENGADAGRALHLDRAAMVFYNFFGDVKTETSAALGLFGRKIGIENSVQLRRMNAGTCVFNAQVNIEILLGASDRYRALFFNRSLNRVDDHVLDCAVDLQRVTEQRT